MNEYRKALQEHMATAPEELRRYVCEKNTIGSYDFWAAIDVKEWDAAMATEFWQSLQNHKPQSDE